LPNFHIFKLEALIQIVIIKKQYIKPEVIKVDLDYSISLVMMTTMPPNPPPRGGGGGKGTDTPFQSPFGDKPFG
jgi:hypothetical protein